MAMSDESRRVVDAARVAYSPSAGDRTRVRVLLVGQLSGMSIASAGTKASASLLGSASSKIVLLGSVVCIAGVVVSAQWAWHKTSNAVASHVGSPAAFQVPIARDVGAAVDAPTGSKLDEQSGGRDVPIAANASNLGSNVHESRSAATRSVKPSLPDVQGEIALLGKAQRALSSGQAAQALVLLDEYARSYPKGTLFEERNAAHIIALCKTGQVVKARAEANVFVRASPHSPLSERVRSSCGDSLNPEGAAK
jgi:hypothetical protein